MSVNEQGKIHFLYIANPLTPSESRNEVVRDFDSSKTLADYLGPLEGEWAVSVSGRLVHKSEWADTYLNQRDCVVVAPILMGGGGGAKNILRLVALVALTYFTMGAGGAAWMGQVGITGGMAFATGAALMIGGTMLINHLMPVPQPKMPSVGDGFSSSPTYGVDGPKNLSSKGIPVPVVYGETWFAGNFIQAHTVNEGNDQYLMLLLNAGEGPIESISDIYVNDQPLANFHGVDVFTRLGEEDQSVIPYFSDVIRPFNRSAVLTTGGWVTHTLSGPVDRVRIDMVLPKGLSYLDNKKGVMATNTGFFAEIREVGGAWRPFDPDTASKGGRITISGKSMSPLRKSFYSGELDRNKRYEIRVIHTEATDGEHKNNAITLADVNEIQYGEIQYKHTALLGLRIKLSDQLSGIPKVVYKVRGRKVRVWDKTTGSFITAWSDNPAWITLDALTNERFGAGMRLERFKLSYWRKWADFCTTNNLKFNGVIDQRTNVWDALLPVYKVGRATPVRAGTRFQVAILGKRNPVQLFSMANIKRDSMSIEWLPMEERATEVVASYFDIEDFGKQKTVTVRQRRALERGEPSRPTEITLYGVNNLEQATREATLAMNMNVLSKTVSFEAPLESIACTLGDVIAVQHDMPKWGQGGRLEAGTTKTRLILDHEVEFDRGGDWVAMVRHDTIVQWTGSIAAVMGNTVILDNTFRTSDFERYRRLKSLTSGQDYQIVEPIVDAMGRHGVLLESASGLKSGDTVELVDTDVIETVSVVPQPAGTKTRELQLGRTLNALPQVGSTWAFGISEHLVSLFSVTGISGNGDMWRKITALEYSEDAYSDEVIDFKPGLPPAAAVLSDVDFQGFYERRYLDGGVYRSTVEFAWTHSSKDYLYAEIHASINGEPFRLLGAAASSYSVEVTSGTLQVKIVPVNLQGTKRSVDATAVHTYEVEVEAPDTPPAPTDVSAVANQDTVELTWKHGAGPSQLVFRFEVWGATGDNESVTIADAELLGITGDARFIHTRLMPETDYTYWVRAINVLDNTKMSEFVPNVGVTVRTAPAATIEDLFPGGIDVSDLFPGGLKFDELFPEGIPVESVFPGGIELEELFPDGSTEAITREVNEKLNKIADLVSKVSAKVEMAADGYKTEVFQRKEAIAEVEAMVRQEIATLVAEDEALARLLTELESRVGEDIVARLAQESITRATADEALAADISRLEASFNSNDADVRALIKSESSARATADEALTHSITAMQTQIDEDITAAIADERLARTAADDALAAQITSLKAEVGDNIAAALEEEKLVRANADEALAADIASLTAQMGTDIQAAITAERLARVDEDMALAQSIDDLEAKTAREIEGVAVEFNAAVTAEREARTAADGALSTAIDTLRADTADLVSAEITSERQARTQADNALVASIEALEAKTGTDIAAAVAAERSARTSEDTALANSIEQLKTKTAKDIEAAVSVERGARTSADDALAASIESLETKTADDIAAAVATERAARTTADEALASSIETLRTETTGNITAAINSERAARVAADEAIVASVASLETDLDGRLNAAISAEQLARSNDVSALTTLINNAQSKADAAARTFRQNAEPTSGMEVGDLWFDADGGNKPYRYDGSKWVAVDDARIAQNAAAISSEATTRASADAALTTQVERAQSTADSKNRTYRQSSQPTGDLKAGDLWYKTNDNNRLFRYDGTNWVSTDDARIAQNAAAIATEAATRANADSALASQISTLTASTNANFASVRSEIQAQADYTDGAVARAVTTATVNGRQAIFGITVNGESADIGAVADRFYIYNRANGTYTQAFLVENGKVYIQSALIKDASITRAKIADAAINTAKIADASITMAKISGAIQSDDYVANVSGWRLTRAGAFEINGSIAGQGRVNITNQAIKVYDGSGKLRVQIGNLNA